MHPITLPPYTYTRHYNQKTTQTSDQTQTPPLTATFYRHCPASQCGHVGCCGWIEPLYPQSQSSPHTYTAAPHLNITTTITKKQILPSTNGTHPPTHDHLLRRPPPAPASPPHAPKGRLPPPPHRQRSSTLITTPTTTNRLHHARPPLHPPHHHNPPHPPTPTTTISTTITIHRLLTSQNSNLILLATLPSPFAPTPLIAKLRLTTAAPTLAAHAHELSILRLLTPHPLFPSLVAHGTAGTQHVPLLLMEYLPHPSLAELLWDPNSALWRGEWGVGDKRALQRDGVLWGGVVAVVEALRGRGLRQGDLRGANVVYDVGGGRVWGVDLEGVVRVEVERGESVDVRVVVEEFWRFELCAPGGRVW
ncbi:uncharacterized protein LAJ45_05432 [Morchella importuna]|uniref:uncharacterized protein n=1 Tax=Morchella importuna TaxID=1174673 RepID=UPI001E8DAB8D|nr:uncharacterized protein LAJ45_05432 [Morchella importuna]KAH8150736.1 hypothetical protein LAJ45_05432 [Morchella importuna]